MAKPSARLAFIFVTVMLDMIGIGLVLPSLPDVMRRFVSEAEVSTYFGYFMAVYALMQLLASPLLGALSDRHGRRPVLLTSLFVAGLDYTLLAFAPTLTWLFLGRVVAGLTGASMTVAFAYVADVSDAETRSGNFGKIGAAFGLGFIIGPALGGFLGHYSPIAPFVAAAVMNLLNFCFGYFVLPESVPPGNRPPLRLGNLNPFRSLVRIFRTPGFLRLGLVFFLFALAGATHGTIWALYTEFRFGWHAAEVGTSLTLLGVLVAFAQGWLTGRVVPRLGEYRTVLAGCVGWTVAFALYGLATHGWMIYAILVVTSPFMIAQPAMQSLVTRYAPPEIQGELQGTLMSLQSLAAILNPLVSTWLFTHFTRADAPVFLPGAPYFLAAVICALSLPLLWRLRHEKPVATPINV